MPLQVVCSGCGAKLRAPDTAAGKKTKCPKCQQVITVPLDAPAPAAASPPEADKSEPGKQKKPAWKGDPAAAMEEGNWYLQTEDGSQYGPVPRKELDEWLAEGRITAECQLLKEGSEQWQWATEIYEGLSRPAAGAPPSKKLVSPAAPSSSLNDLGAIDQDPLGILAPQTALATLPAMAPAAPTMPAFGGAAPVNPYSAPAPVYLPPSAPVYFGARPRGEYPHAMVIIAAIMQFISAFFFFTQIVIIILFLFGFMAIGAVAGSDMDAQEAAEFGTMMAVVSGLRFVLLAIAIAFFTADIVVGLGMLKRKNWARISAIILSVLRMLGPVTLPFIFGCFFGCLGGLFEAAVGILVLIAMVLPDAVADFE